MKVLFLDVDGVLNYVGCDAYYGSVYFVVEEKLQMLTEIIDRTGAQIVLTSTWRYGFADQLLGQESFEADLYEALVNIMEEHGLEIYDCTGEAQLTRGVEIALWLQAAEEEIEAFAILDDMESGQFGQYESFLIQTDIEKGLNRYHVESAIQMLNEI